jgi:HEXXH motif-containing protein
MLRLYSPTPLVERRVSEEIEGIAADVLLQKLLRTPAIVADSLGADEDVQTISGVLFAFWRAWTLFYDLPKAVQEQCVLQPAFRYFLHVILKDQGNQQAKTVVRSFASMFPTLVWSAAIGHSPAIEISIPLDEFGGLRALPHHRFVEFGTKRASEICVAEIDSAVVRFRFSDRMTATVPHSDIVGALGAQKPDIDKHGYTVNASDLVGSVGIRVHNRDPWLRVKLTGTHQRTTGASLFDRDDDIYSSSPELSSVSSAINIVDAVWPEEAEDMALFIKSVLIYRPSDATYSAFTTSSRQGAIFLGVAPPLPLLEMMLHEKAHVKLRQIQLSDSLLLDPLDEAFRVKVPWRPDPRPLPGIFEGLYVFTHVCECMGRIYKFSDEPWALRRTRKLIGDLTEARTILAENAKLTEAGQAFFSSMSAWIDDLSAEFRNKVADSG